MTPQVFTVYDLILHLFPESYPNEGRSLELEHMRRCFLNAAAIICISASTKSDLLRLHADLDPSKVSVVPLGVDEQFFRPPGLPETTPPYFLFVGTRIGYKNFVNLVEGFAISGLAKDFLLRVVSPGRHAVAGWSDAEFKTIESHGLQESVKLIGEVSEHELIAYYSRATAFVQPSKYEGFGLPVLEAMAAGTIVACSNTSSLPEAGGDAAFYFDPFDPESIATSLLQITQLSAQQRQERILAGQVHARTMSWDRCVSRTCNILESVASGSIPVTQSAVPIQNK